MEPREMSESMQEFEKDVTLNSESAVNAEETDVKNEVTPEVESVQEEEKTLVEEAPIEPVAEVAATDEVAAEDEPLAVNYAEMGKEQLVEALEQIAQKPIETVKGEVAAIKAAFFAIRKNELAEEKAAFL